MRGRGVGGGGGGLERIHLPQGEGRERDLPDRGNQMIKHRERDG